VLPVTPGRAERRTDTKSLPVVQALDHLFSNAIKFTSSGRHVMVEAGIGDRGPFVLLLRNTGIGVAEADLEKLIQPCHQAVDGLARRFEAARAGLFSAAASRRMAARARLKAPSAKARPRSSGNPRC
jgi:signal transduction histidine kinase